MKKCTLLLFTLLLTNTIIRASYSIDWMRTPDLLANKGSAIALDSADNVYSATTYNGSIYLEKRNRFGVFQWQRISATTVPLNYERPIQVHVDPQGNPVVIGYRHTHSSDGDNANALIALKYDPLGTFLYKHNFDGTYSYFNNSQYWTHISSQMDAYGNIFIGTAGLVSGYVTSGYNAIKISPAGNIIRVSTKNFPSATNFHVVNQIRLYGDKLGLAGVTDYSSANASTWVLDTTGNDLWSNISAGVQGGDVAFDNSGNVYMLTWISIAQMGDIAFYKFDAYGNQLWVRNLDFGGSDVAGKIKPTPDGNFAIMAYGNQAPSISYYMSWLTLKVDTSGTVLWSDRYNETTHNDELPGAFTIDDVGNIYVTGIGGPFPGGPIISARQMITVKYSPSGIREWASPIDTINEYNKGVGIEIASDSSIFVLGDVNTLIIHYLDHTGSAPCSVPMNITSTVLADDSVRIDWTDVPDAYLYHIQYKTTSSVTWATISTNTTSYFIAQLYPGTAYDFCVEAICNSGPTGYSAIQQFTTTGSGYCVSMGLTATHDWIDLVFIENLLNSSPLSATGYSDFTYLSTTLIPGNTYDITLSAEMDIPGSSEIWKVWIDFNNDQDFTDIDEEVVSYSSTEIGWETSIFTVPSTATPGNTRMRVSMQDDTTNLYPCGNFADGEVEDYTVIISNLTGMPKINTSMDKNISVYPNPVLNILTVKNNQLQGNYAIQLLDLTGRIVFYDPFTEGKEFSIDVHNLSAGFYLLRLTYENNMQATVKWLKE